VPGCVPDGYGLLSADALEAEPRKNVSNADRVALKNSTGRVLEQEVARVFPLTVTFAIETDEAGLESRSPLDVIVLPGLPIAYGSMAGAGDVLRSVVRVRPGPVERARCSQNVLRSMSFSRTSLSSKRNSWFVSPPVNAVVVHVGTLPHAFEELEVEGRGTVLAKAHLFLTVVRRKFF